MPQDEHGEYDKNAGSLEPVEGRCNAVLKYTIERYGETRFCTQYPESHFKYRGSDYCKHHKSREALMSQHKENFKTGAYVKSYSDFFEYIEPHKRVIAVDLFKDLSEQSKYEFDSVTVEMDVDLSTADWANVPTATVEFPLPREYKSRAKYIWMAVLEFMKMEAVEYQIFEDSLEGGHETDGIAERDVVVTANEFGKILDAGEHHLNLPLSRMIKDHKALLKMGGLEVDGKEAEEAAERVMREWVTSVEPKEPPSKESDTGDSEASSDPMDYLAPEGEN